MPIDPFPVDPPSTGSPTDFDSRGDQFLGHLPTFATQATALEENVNLKEAAAAASATAAEAAAALAAAGASVTVWNSGATYTQNVSVVRSPINQQLYVRKGATGSGGADPSSNSADWELAVVLRKQQVAVGTSITLTANVVEYYSSASCSPLLPAAPVDGDMVVIRQTNLLHSITIQRNGKTIEGYAEDVLIDKLGIDIEFIYVAATGNWKISY
jgi:hypothetical protein